MVKHITVNGRQVAVLNSYSTGPNDKNPFAYDIKGGYVFYTAEAASDWWIQEPGQFKRPVTVAVAQ